MESIKRDRRKSDYNARYGWDPSKKIKHVDSESFAHKQTRVFRCSCAGWWINSDNEHKPVSKKIQTSERQITNKYEKSFEKEMWDRVTIEFNFQWLEKKQLLFSKLTVASLELTLPRQPATVTVRFSAVSVYICISLPVL